MLSDQDVLPPQSRFYQRLLALDPEEATEVAEDFLATSSLTELYDVVILPALSLAEQDRHHGDLDEEKQRFVHQTTREIVEELGERIGNAASETRWSFGRGPRSRFSRAKGLHSLLAGQRRSGRDRGVDVSAIA